MNCMISTFLITSRVSGTPSPLTIYCHHSYSFYTLQVQVLRQTEGWYGNDNFRRRSDSKYGPIEDYRQNKKSFCVHSMYRPRRLLLDAQPICLFQRMTQEDTLGPSFYVVLQKEQYCAAYSKMSLRPKLVRAEHLR